MDDYQCENCGETWNFFSEDYDTPYQYPTTCPLCNMPVSQMIREVFEEEGVCGVLRMLYLRFL